MEFSCVIRFFWVLFFGVFLCVLGFFFFFFAEGVRDVFIPFSAVPRPPPLSPNHPQKVMSQF